MARPYGGGFRLRQRHFDRAISRNELGRHRNNIENYSNARYQTHPPYGSFAPCHISSTLIFLKRVNSPSTYEH